MPSKNRPSYNDQLKRARQKYASDPEHREKCIRQAVQWNKSNPERARKNRRNYKLRKRYGEEGAEIAKALFKLEKELAKIPLSERKPPSDIFSRGLSCFGKFNKESKVKAPDMHGIAERIRDRFCNYIEFSDCGCWNWTGKVLKSKKRGRPKPRLKVGGSTFISAKRLGIVLFEGLDVPKNNYIVDLCDNPYCVNPNHMSFKEISFVAESTFTKAIVSVILREGL